MKVCLTLVILSIMAITVYSDNHPGERDISEVILLTNLIKSVATTILKNCKIVCTDVVERGALAFCPPDFVPFSCSCGMGCGSWDIRNQNTCHCQCSNIDWTSVRCCKISYS
ncbi:resistin-like beta [Phyllobates terribilis]|uniref:resistin-like beta n=1 Tax=Phyllobates terribilis TaxID=111132 RepID=UPI003CCB62C9